MSQKQPEPGRALFEALADAVIVVDELSGLILEVNPATAHTYGYTREELLGQRATLLSAVGGPPSPLVQHRRKDGTTFPAEISTSVMDWAGQRATILVVRDVTLLSSAFYGSPLLLAVSDLADDRYLEVNDAFCARVGFSRNEMVGRTAVELGLIDPAGREALGKKLMASLPDAAFELVIRSRAGVLISCRYWARVLHTGAGPRLFAAAEDITERKRLEAGLAQNDRLASMGMLAAGVAHEINNPLSYVLASLDALAQELPKLTEVAPALLAELVESAQSALEGTRRIRKISRSLGAFSRVERVEVHHLDLNQTIETAATMAHNEVKYRAVLIKELGQVPPVRASDGKLAQVFLNLIINAAHAIAEGNVERNRITVRTWSDGRDVFAEVADTGQGIAPENLERIFEPFFTTKRAGAGSGLGLPISRNIITEFGGDIWVHSEVGKGTRLTVRLPASTSTVSPAPVSPIKRPTPSPRGRVLVVDDEPAIRRVLERMLGQWHEVVTASSGREAQALLERDVTFDVILCDVMMPELTGVDLHAWLVKHSPELARRLVFISGGAFTPSASEYLATVENLRLDKPFDPMQLLELVTRLVRTARGELTAAGA